MRYEEDVIGKRSLPDHTYYGLQTLRAQENFPLHAFPRLLDYPKLVTAMVQVKQACAEANFQVGKLSKEKYRAIKQAAQEIAGGKLLDQFILNVMQGGAGTSENMNVNEVVANRGLEILGHAKGDYQHLHPNDDVNMSQSTNDVCPTAIKLCILATVKDLQQALDELIDCFSNRADAFGKIAKLGRTQMQDAVPMTLGQEMASFADLLRDGKDILSNATKRMLLVSLGGTAIGTSVNAPPDYRKQAIQALRAITGEDIRPVRNLITASSDTSDLLVMTGALKTIALQLFKICSDLILLSSGPYGGLGELTLPPQQLGSTIMPGKINPVIPEFTMQICATVMGQDLSTTIAATSAQLQLNAFTPVITCDLLRSLSILDLGIKNLAHKCTCQMVANEARCLENMERGFSMLAAFIPEIGYEKASRLAKQALVEKRNILSLLEEQGGISKEKIRTTLRSLGAEALLNK